MHRGSVLTLLCALPAGCASERAVEPASAPAARVASPTAPDAGSAAPERPAAAPEAPSPAPAPTPPAWEGAASLLSHAGTYRLLYRTTPAAIERGKPFAIDVWVFSARDPSRPLAGLALQADAAMPEHGHGMNRVPAVTRREDGGLHVEGMLFHMLGPWQLYLDVIDGPLAERAQVDVELE